MLEKPDINVLIIEDEPLIALELQQMLANAGFGIVGVAGKLETALGLIASETFDAAVVDSSLGEDSAAPAAALLAEAGIPFVVLSGYPQELQPPALQSAPLIAKPCQEAELVDTLRRVCERR